MKGLCWAEIDPTSWNVDDVEGEPFGNGFFEIMDNLRGPPDDVVLGEVANDRSNWMNEANVAGHRLVLGTECPAEASSETTILEVIAIDDRGRIAGIGFGAEQFTTIPLARAAAANAADSGEAYLLSILNS